MKSTTDRVLTIVFAALIAVNMFYLLVGFLSMPVFYDRITSLTIQPRDMPGASLQSNESVVQRAEAQGLSLAQFAAGQIAFHSAMVLVFLGVAALIMLRAGWNWFAWYSAFFLVFIAEYVLYDEIYIARLMPILVYEAGSLLWPLILLYFFLFPNGKPVPRRALWVVLPAFVLHIIFQMIAYIYLLLPSSEIWKPFEIVVGVFQTFIILIFIFILGCQIYRYLRVSNPEEKQQTKWFIMGFIFFLALSTINDALGASNPYHSEINLLIFAFVPISLGIAILRYRLWDIDLVIRRTLVYSLLTAILGLTYFGSVVLLQNILTSEGDQPTTVSIVLTTLLIAALFSPLRRRLQDFIDRRFYRQKYDAEKALAGFATLARNETDLETLSTSMLHIIQATMQPSRALIWLRPESKRQVKDQELL